MNSASRDVPIYAPIFSCYSPRHPRRDNQTELISDKLAYRIKLIAASSNFLVFHAFSCIIESTEVYNVRFLKLQGGPKIVSYCTLFLSSLNIDQFSQFFTSKLCKKICYSVACTSRLLGSYIVTLPFKI